MIPVSSTIKTACDSDKVVYKEYIIINGNTVEIKGKMSNTAYKNGNIFGTFNLKKLEFETENDIDYKKKEVVYYKSVNGESFKIGTYIVTEVKDNDSKETVSVTAMDYGLKFAIPYVSTLDYTSGTITLFDVLSEACTNAGVSLANTSITNGDFIVDSNQFVNGELIGDVVCAVSQMSGDFATTNEDDELELVFEEETDEIIEDYEDLDDKRDTHPITSVSIGDSQITGQEAILRDEDLIALYGEHWLNLNDNPLAYTLAKREELVTDIFNKVKGFSYSSFESKYAFKPYSQLGDKIKFRNKNGTLVNSRILKIDTNYDEIKLSAPSITDSSVEYVKPEPVNTQKQTEIIVNRALSNIQITADHINLEGYTTVNGSFAIDEGGTVSIGGILDGSLYNLLPNSSGLEDLDKWTISHTWNQLGTNSGGVTSGKLADAEPWTAKTYILGDLCTYNGKVYMANTSRYQSGTFLSNIAYWDAISIYTLFDAGNYFRINARISAQPGDGEYLLSDEIIVKPLTTYNFSAKNKCYPKYDIYEGNYHYHNYHIQIIESFNEVFSNSKITELFIANELYSEAWQNITKTFTTGLQTKKLKIKIISKSNAITDDDWNVATFMISDILLDEKETQRDWTFNPTDEVLGSTQINNSSFKVSDIDGTTELIKISKGGIYSKSDIKTDGSLTFENDINGITKAELNYLNGVSSNIQTQINDMLLKVYPIGSIYMSVVNTSPATLFGGTWVAITGYYLYAGTGGTTAGSNTSGGSSNANSGSTAITVAQMPSHYHLIKRGWGENTSSPLKIFADITLNYANSIETMQTDSAGSGEGHTHTIAHTHSIEPLRYEVYVWRRTA